MGLPAVEYSTGYAGVLRFVLGTLPLCRLMGLPATGYSQGYSVGTHRLMGLPAALYAATNHNDILHQLIAVGAAHRTVPVSTP